MTPSVRGRIAIGVATVLFLLLPAGGLVGGGYAAYQWAKPEGLDCGLCVFPHLMVTGFGALFGLAAGLGAGWLIARGLFRWANGCGLGDIRDDRPFV